MNEGVTICDMGAKKKRQRFYCKTCKQTRLAEVTYYFDYVRAVCSKGHEYISS